MPAVTQRHSVFLSASQEYQDQILEQNMRLYSRFKDGVSLFIFQGSSLGFELI